MPEITGRQEEILAKLWYFDQTQKKSPSIREVKKIMEVSSNQSAADMLDRLEKDGWIQKKEGKARSITLTQKAQDYLVGVGANQVISHYASLAGNNLRTIDSEIADATQSPGTNHYENSYINHPDQGKGDPTLKNTTLRHLDSFLNNVGTKAAEEMDDFIPVPLVLTCMTIMFILLTRSASLSFVQSLLATIILAGAGLFFINYRK